MMPSAPATATHVSTASTHASATATHANATTTDASATSGLCSQSLSKAWRRNGQWCRNRQNGCHQYWFETEHIRNSMSDFF
jgi:hypothetical protein